MVTKDILLSDLFFLSITRFCSSWPHVSLLQTSEKPAFSVIITVFLVFSSHIRSLNTLPMSSVFTKLNFSHQKWRISSYILTYLHFWNQKLLCNIARKWGKTWRTQQLWNSVGLLVTGTDVHSEKFLPLPESLEQIPKKNPFFHFLTTYSD